MVSNHSALYHFHKRKKEILGKEEKSNLKAFVDKIIYIVAASGPIMTIPQVYKIWHEKNASGVSLISWASYLIAAIIWLFYGVMHKEKPIIFTEIVWIVLQLAIIFGVFLYG